MKRHLLPILISFFAGVIILGSPTENQFLNRLSKDYGVIHGVPLSREALKEIGQTYYSSYILWSEYEYAFGTIKVRYVGIAFMTFHIGSDTKDQTTLETKQIIS